MELMAEAMNDVRKTKSPTFRMAADEYAESKKNVLSPRTYREYKRCPNWIPKWFVDTEINQITQQDIQRCINELAQDKAPKTVRNYHGFISAVLGYFRPTMVISTTLPKKLKNEPYIPTESEVKKLLEYTKKNAPNYYLAVALASSCGLRRSEILALKPSDIKDGIMRISSAVVQDYNNEWVQKGTKTEESTRYVPIPPELSKQIIEQGYVYDGHPHEISAHIKRSLIKLGIPHFSLHKLRHFYASQLLANGVPLQDVKKLGGWEYESKVLEEIYAHAMKTRTDEEKIRVSQSLWNTIF